MVTTDHPLLLSTPPITKRSFSPLHVTMVWCKLWPLAATQKHANLLHQTMRRMEGFRRLKSSRQEARRDPA